MKKKRIGIAVCVFLLVVLGIGYAYLNQQETDPLPDEDKTETILTSLIEKEQTEVVEAVFESADHTFIFKPKQKQDDDPQYWVLEGYENTPLDHSAVNAMIQNLYHLSYQKKVVENPADLNDYGLASPKISAQAVFTDGSSFQIQIGDETPAKDGYYAMIRSENTIYLLDAAAGRRFLNDLNALVDKTLPILDLGSLQYIYIRERDGQEIEGDYTGSEREKKAELEQYGMVTLTMLKPYSGREIYLSQLTEKVLTAIDDIKLLDLIDASPTSLEPYGLQEPELEITLIDKTDLTYHLLIGDAFNERQSYAMTAGNPAIFTVNTESLSPFYQIDVFEFIDRFVLLENIGDVDEIILQTSERTDEMQLNHTVIPAENEEEEEEEEEEVIRPVVNGQEVQEKAFKTFYQNLIGLSFDSGISAFSPPDQPELTITFRRRNGKEDAVLRYYDYNVDFYAIQGSDNLWYAVSRQMVNIMRQSLADLQEGKLDV